MIRQILAWAEQTLRNIFSICLGILVLPLAAGWLAAQSPSGSASPLQGAGGGAEDHAGKAAARKKKFEEARRRLELGESGLDSASGELYDSSPMRIVYLTPNIGTGKNNRHTTESLRVDYELDRDLSQGSLEVVSANSVTASYPLPSLVHGHHTMTIPRGIPLANDPYTFTCNLPKAHYSGITQTIESLWDNRDRDSSNLQFPKDDDASIYDYKPGPPIDDRDDAPADDAAAFRGDEVAICSFNIPHKRNRMLLSTGRSPEIQILGVNFDEGDEVVCTKQSFGNPPIQASTRLHDVRTVSAASHEKNDSIPVLRAGRFDVPETIVAHGTFVRIVGKFKVAL